MRANEPALPADFGRYTLLERVGGGGMAAVYRASLRLEGGFEKEVALKLIRDELASDPQFVGMFLDEARLSARLSHPNLVQTFDFGQADGSYYLAMEFVAGCTLAQLLRSCRGRGTRLGVAAGVHVAAEVAKGLGHAHRLVDGEGAPLGLVHRDVSPQNVLVSREGQVKLADFGIAKAASRSHVTQTGKVRGKCAYMAPEQARAMELDGRTDLFALGIVLWECLTGRALFDGPSDGAVLLQVIQKEIPLPSRLRPEVPAAVDAMVARLLSREPAGRPENGAAAARELGDLLISLVRSQEEIDLAELQRRLAEPVVVPVPMVRESAPPWPAGTESLELDTRALWNVDPEAETRIPASRTPAATKSERVEPPVQRTYAPSAEVRASWKRRGLAVSAGVVLALGSVWAALHERDVAGLETVASPTLAPVPKSAPEAPPEAVTEMSGRENAVPVDEPVVAEEQDAAPAPSVAGPVAEPVSARREVAGPRAPRGHLVLSTLTPGARVSIDGQVYRLAIRVPREAELSPGAHRLEVHVAGQPGCTAELELAAGARRAILVEVDGSLHEVNGDSALPLSCTR